MKLYLRILSVLLLITATLTDDFGFNLEDALGPDPTTKKPKEQPVTPKKPGSNDGLDLFDALGPDPTQAPKKPSSGDSGGFDLEDALKPGPTLEPKKPAFKPPSGGGGGNINDNDLIELTNGDYKPDGGRSGGRAVDPGYNNEGGSDQPKDPNLLWGQILKMLNTNMPEEFFMWISNLKQVIGPLLARAMELLQALP